MTKLLANLDKYRVIHLERAQVPALLIADLSVVVVICTILWLWFSDYIVPGSFLPQCLLTTVVTVVIATWDVSVQRIHIELKAKGLKIKSKTQDALIPWDWLKTVELRYRGWNIFPNYVCFNFKDQSDSLILLDDILKEMDITTLIEVRPDMGARS